MGVNIRQMKFSRTFALASLAPAITAFTSKSTRVQRASSISMSTPAIFGSDIAKALDKEVSYSPGQADTDFARKYGHLAGAKIRTVGEAFNAFTDMLGTPVNALYKGICTDLVGSLHLIMVNARFQSDAVFKKRMADRCRSR